MLMSLASAGARQSFRNVKRLKLFPPRWHPAETMQPYVSPGGHDSTGRIWWTQRVHVA